VIEESGPAFVASEYDVESEAKELLRSGLAACGMDFVDSAGGEVRSSRVEFVAQGGLKLFRVAATLFKFSRESGSSDTAQL